MPWDLLIVDEAHNLLPSPFGEDNQLVKALSEISPLFEHKLFLTATPHNGHTRSFSGLLEILDPVRFTQTSEFKDNEKERVQQVLVRRLKSEINELDSKNNRPNRFPQRHLDSKQLFLTKEERALSHAVEEFRKAVKSKIAASLKSEQLAGSFAIEILSKRLLSSPFTFAESWYRFLDGAHGEDRGVEPQYLMGRADFRNAEGAIQGLKIAYRRIAPTTNSRSFICTTLPPVPCGDSIFLLESGQIDGWILPSILNSLTFDWLTRQRLVGANLSYFLIADLPLLSASLVSAISQLTASLLWPHIRFAQFWSLSKLDRPWKSLWALRKGERLRQRVIAEAFIANHFGLTEADFREVVKQCDYPVELVASNEFSRKLDPKGFWRFQKDEVPEHRLAVLAQVAFHELRTLGMESFLSQNDGNGWMLPEALRLADYGLGHHDCAKEHQPVAAALGPRFYTWQLEQSVEESWEECERHANILTKLLPSPDPEKKSDSEDGAAAVDLFGNRLETDLFGNPSYAKSGKR